MADSKISALTDGGNLQGSDQVAINRGGTSYRAVALQDGWIDDTAETWTYASGSGGGTATFTVTGDVTAKYPVGTRIKLTQTTIKYFVVIAVAVAGGTTTVTITAGSDYTLANAAISVNFHSYAASPQGYPGWFAFAAAHAGFSSIASQVNRFALVGRTMTVFINVSGTSNATTWTFTAPAASAQANVLAICRVTDNGTAQNQPGRALINQTTTVTMGLNLVNNAGFTNSGTKAVILLSLVYEI